jgi:hypothetical protein
MKHIHFGPTVHFASAPNTRALVSNGPALCKAGIATRTENEQFISGDWTAVTCRNCLRAKEPTTEMSTRPNECGSCGKDHPSSEPCKKPTHLVRITLFAAYDRAMLPEYYAGLETITEGFAEQLRDDANALTVGSNIDEGEAQLDHDDDDLIDAVIAHPWEPAPKPFALYTSTARHGVNGISLHKTAREAYDALAAYLQIGHEDEAEFADDQIPEDFEDLIEWCEARAEDDRCDYYVTEVELP